MRLTNYSALDVRSELQARRHQRERVQRAELELSNLERALRVEIRDQIHECDRILAAPGPWFNAHWQRAHAAFVLREHFLIPAFILLSFGALAERARYALNPELRAETVAAIRRAGGVRADDGNWIEGVVMNVSEQYARSALLEQNPELLRQIETLKEHPASVKAVLQESTLVETDELWPEPAPLGGELPAVATFDMNMLPEALRPLVEDTAERMQVSPDFPATVTVLCLAGATGRRATIQPKAADNTFTVVPNLWGGIVAPPGMMKSPVITTITRPLTSIEVEHRNEYESAGKQFAQAQEESDLRLSAWREQYKAAAKSGSTPPERPNFAMIAPTCKRLITQDSTAEKLHELMRDNPAGILVIRDELTGWLATLDKPGREGERICDLSPSVTSKRRTKVSMVRGAVSSPESHDL